jgi:hypothetical protein
MTAQRQFGNTTLLQEDRRALQILPSIEVLWYDLRYSLRTLSKSGTFAAVSIATLGLGIAAATSIFSVIHNVLLEPFPYQGAARMVFPLLTFHEENWETFRLSLGSCAIAGRAPPSNLAYALWRSLGQGISVRCSTEGL